LRIIEWEPKEFDKMEPVMNDDGSMKKDELTKETKFKKTVMDALFTAHQNFYSSIPGSA